MATSSPTPPPAPDFCTFLTESKRTTNARRWHFCFLSLLFFLPVSLSPVISSSFLYLLSNSKILSLLISFLWYLFFFALYLLGVGSTAYSVYHGFHGRSVTLLSAIKASLSSFFPLFISLLWVSFLVPGCGFFLLSWFEPFLVVVLLVFLVILAYFQSHWALVFAIVIMESNWGIEPYKRSNLLMQGMRKEGLWLLLCYYGFFSGAYGLWGFSVWQGNENSIRVSVLQIVTFSCMLTMLFLSNVASFTVLYIYCKAVHGGEVAAASENMSDAEVPLLISAVNA